MGFHIKNRKIIFEKKLPLKDLKNCKKMYDPKVTKTRSQRAFGGKVFLPSKSPEVEADFIQF